MLLLATWKHTNTSTQECIRKTAGLPGAHIPIKVVPLLSPSNPSRVQISSEHLRGKRNSCGVQVKDLIWTLDADEFNAIRVQHNLHSYSALADWPNTFKRIGDFTAAVAKCIRAHKAADNTPVPTASRIGKDPWVCCLLDKSLCAPGFFFSQQLHHCSCQHSTTEPRANRL